MDALSHLKKIEVAINNVKTTQIELDLDLSLDEQFKAQFNFFQKISSPTLYWFECKTLEEAKEIKTLFTNKRNELIAVPPINGNLSKVLYLGVRQGGKYKREKTFSRISGRIYHHYGLYSVESTQGLKLNKWAINSGKKIYLNILELDLNETQYLYILEKIFALELNPMFGKH
ncbi:hypothetical protein B0A78_10960 [Flavobacterium columnare NBRC 100251 = ATCC 23463]|uniref:hypothetical protein n=1 Tax=Flavobacterium columnare TaxID=996 RepID=UPI0007F9D6D4|nr:hypothetical protein [Flavobacterium columnare]ANO48702.1 hypothetical protein Pf1_00454 [Flavobacterium columnare]APT23261.1 hypothetical protein BU993_11900 [Flavobacterium columnare]PDS22907.1 hypothetical protein B0A78_10960 [Flavobacterium columnare NBRC 100251 = ATCC 23463]PTD15156.1 hypothetical protein C6N29_12370 [Flavobacterium columnare]GEM59049.1 hypothetical protein FC1_22870 [Flavobacterium columnare NBRC 100251 = ATCC 23463]